MTIDFKGFFRNKNHRQRKINNLGGWSHEDRLSLLPVKSLHFLT
jgi:hypothetical protein